MRGSSSLLFIMLFPVNWNLFSEVHPNQNSCFIVHCLIFWNDTVTHQFCLFRGAGVNRKLLADRLPLSLQHKLCHWLGITNFWSVRKTFSLACLKRLRQTYPLLHKTSVSESEECTNKSKLTNGLLVTFYLFVHSSSDLVLSGLQESSSCCHVILIKL